MEFTWIISLAPRWTPEFVNFRRGICQCDFGNPSALHSRGLAARATLEEARTKVAELINAEGPENIIFTGGVTEANNLAVRGVAQRNAGIGKKLLASSIEHISVLNPLKDLKKSGYELALVPVNELWCHRSGPTGVSSLQRDHTHIGDVCQQRDRNHRAHTRG